jgi:hypothetical protein
MQVVRSLSYITAFFGYGLAVGWGMVLLMGSRIAGVIYEFRTGTFLVKIGNVFAFVFVSGTVMITVLGMAVVSKLLSRYWLMSFKTW